MNAKHLLIFGLAGLLTGCSTGAGSPDNATGQKSLEDYQRAAAKFNSVISLPVFETTTNELAQSVTDAIATGNKAMDRIGQLAPAEVNFTNTLRALDDAVYQAGLTENRLEIIRQASTNGALRDAADDQKKLMDQWMVSLDYRQDVYRAVKAYAGTHPNLQGEDAKMLAETMRDYRRAGLSLPPEQQKEVEELRKKLSGLETDFEANINKAEQKVVFTTAEMDGVPDDFLNQKGVQNFNGTYTVMANITWHYLTVMENAKSEAARLKMETARCQLARAENVPILQQVLVLRDTIAHKLGYTNWADFQTEIKMAKTGARATDFLEKLKTGLQPKFDSEKAEFRAMKVKDTGDANAQVLLWDWRYYANQLKKEKYTVDEEALRVYFPYQAVLDGMFRIYQHIFGLKFQQITPPYKWVSDLQLYAVSDAATGEPMGMFYLDMFPREGKYNHFAEFSIIDGKLLSDGRYQRPTVALICNFPGNEADDPGLLQYSDVVTYFHEFGHLMHAILGGQTEWAGISGFATEGDFIEVPSQMLEEFFRDENLLQSFAKHYQTGEVLPLEIIRKMKLAGAFGRADWVRSQLYYTTLSLDLHDQDPAALDLDQITKSLYQSLQPWTWMEGNKMYASFGHLTEYSSNYYTYAFDKVIALDFYAQFDPQDPLGCDAGGRYRTLVLEQGGSKPGRQLVRDFLGRDEQFQAFSSWLNEEFEGDLALTRA